MNTIAIPPQIPGTLPTPRRSQVVIQGKAAIPSWVDDLESYCRWARTSDFPREGWTSYLGSEIWVDLSTEEFLTHNQVKAAFTFALMCILQQHPWGRFVPDRMFLKNTEADLATEPDGLFFYYATLQAGRIRLIKVQEDGGILELEGAPDMVLEIVSKNSVRKDMVRLPELYWKAGIPEYWLVNALEASPRFDILQRGPDGYHPTVAKDNWLPSPLFKYDFQLIKQKDPIGNDEYRVLFRETNP